MQQFINYIISFVFDIYRYIREGIINAIGNDTSYSTFLSKFVFTENSLIGINLTWNELLRFIPIWFLVIFFIVIFVRFIFKLLGIFRFNRLND